MRRWFVILCVVLMLSWHVPTARSQTLQERIRALLRRKETKQDQAQAVRRRLRALRRKQRSIVAELEDTQRHLEKTNHQLRQATRDLRRTERQLQITDRQLKAAQARLSAHQQAFGKRLRALQRGGRLNEVSLLLGATSFSDFLRRRHIFRRIVDYDADLMARLQTQRARVKAFRRLWVERRDKARQLRALIVQRQRRLQRERNHERQLLARIHSDRVAHERYLAELEQSSREIENLIRRLRRPRPSLSGRWVVLGNGLMRPVAGRLTSRFGSRYHPILRRAKWHTGVDLAAPWGATVRAAASGTVIFAGWKRAYGKTLVVDHGNGIATVYGHCSALLVSLGARVRRGQPIARVGSTGVSTGPHLHFEVRRGGKPVNPLR
ncbi:MAG: peptidoglycan DD-metalloendopeptidase family protein [Abditibacteriales bacterium]|nr:peptidoglycan DD-metalloendopeptidase family protein [Abditibacteriales bacterium]MDW8365927.1 peptidoglycan DD-metalloendopeptidase family protein [Abditibacteriales bacterium]